MRLYEQAVRSARDNNFVQNEGLAHELAARFYAARGVEKIANQYLRDARYCYLQWGAHGEVKQLDECYPYLQDERVPAYGAATIGRPSRSWTSRRWSRPHGRYRARLFSRT